MSTGPKSKNYTIRETAKMSGLPESTLRYYETLGLIDAIPRDEATKRRVYSEDNVNQVIAIACLNAIGLSIEDMRKYLNNRNGGDSGASDQIDLLSNHANHIRDEIHFMQLRLQYVESKVDFWKAIKEGDKKKIETVGKQVYSIADKMKLPKPVVVESEE